MRMVFGLQTHPLHRGRILCTYYDLVAHLINASLAAEILNSLTQSECSSTGRDAGVP